MLSTAQLADAESLQADLLSRFGDGIKSHPDALNEATSLCRRFGVPPEELFYKWVAFAINNAPAPKESDSSKPNENADEITLDRLRQLGASLQRDHTRQRTATAAPTLATPRRVDPLAGPSSRASLRKEGTIGKMLAGKGVATGSPATPYARGGSSAGRSSLPESLDLNNRSASSVAVTPARSGVFGSSRHDAIDTPSRPTRLSHAGPSSMDIDSPVPRISTSVGTIKETLQAHVLENVPVQHPLPASRVAFSAPFHANTYKYRYMSDRPSKKGDALDDRIDEMAEAIRQCYRLEEDFADPSSQSQEPVYVVGRICAPVTSVSRTVAIEPVDSVLSPASVANRPVLDDDKTPLANATSQDGQGKMDSKNLLLETSRIIGSGSRTPVTFAPKCAIRLSQEAAPIAEGTSGIASLFPGMIVALRGQNGSGKEFLVQEILFPPLMGVSATGPTSLLNWQYSPERLAGEPLRLIVASGPFTAPEDLDYLPWHNLLDQVEKECPDVLLLLGPFVASNHPIVASGLVEELPEETFRKHISQRLSTLAKKCPGTTTILVPSTLDLVGTPHAAFPQPPFDKKNPELGLDPKSKSIRCLPNPCVFNVNEMRIGAFTADVLGDLRKHEHVKLFDMTNAPGIKPATTNAIGAKHNGEVQSRVFRQILEQRSFHPMFPLPDSSTHPLEISRSHLTSLGDTLPDLLILPSGSLTPFARLVDGTVAINSGHSCGGAANTSKAAGVFARVLIVPTPREELESVGTSDDVALPHKIYQRARVDLISL